MAALMLIGCSATALLALALSLLVGDASRRERRDADARSARRARVLRRPVIVSASYAGAERRQTPRVATVIDRHAA